MQRFRSPKALTLLELLTVMAIIIVLASMILHGIGYAQKRGATSRAEAEIAAISTALENYKIDHGDYPRTPSTVDDEGNVVKQGTDTVIPVNVANGKFDTAVKDYPSLSGVLLLAELEGGPNKPSYFFPKGDMVNPSGDRYLIDPFGTPYGYSTAGVFNPTFDLWSTIGMTSNHSGASVDDPVDRYWKHNW